MKSSAKRILEWELDIIGDGDLFDQIRADAKRRHLEKRVHFVGYTNEPEKVLSGILLFFDFSIDKAVKKNGTDFLNDGCKRKKGK